MTTPRSKRLTPLVAAGLAATSLSFTAPAWAGGAASASQSAAAPTGAYSGFSASGVATPVKVEIFEPTSAAAASGIVIAFMPPLPG